MSMTGTPPIAVTEFDALMPHNRAPISQQTNIAFFPAHVTRLFVASARPCAPSRPQQQRPLRKN